MRRLISIFVLALVGLSIANGALADSPKVSGQLEIDARAALDPNGKDSAKLYAETLSGRVQLNDTCEVDLEAVNKYGTAAVTRASVDLQRDRVSVDAGIMPLPFGIYNSQETYTSGLIGYPLARSGFGAYAVGWTLPGVSATANLPKVQITAGAMDGRAYGDWGNSSKISTGAVRAQTYFGDLIVGASYRDGSQSTQQYNSYYGTFYDARQRVAMTGVDARYSRSHLVLRGEYIHQHIVGETCDGAYLDAYYRLPGVETVTLVGRIECLTEDGEFHRQLVVGARYTIARGWSGAFNVRMSNEKGDYDWSGFGGQRVLLQLYHVIGY